MAKNTRRKNIAMACDSYLNSMQYPVDMAPVMKQWKITPYAYVHQSLELFVNEDYEGAFKLLDFAGEFEGLYYAKGTAENENFGNTIKLLHYLMLHLADEFSDCIPDK